MNQFQYFRSQYAQIGALGSNRCWAGEATLQMFLNQDGAIFGRGFFRNITRGLLKLLDLIIM